MALRNIKRELQERGFDLCHTIHTKWYNDLIKSEGLVQNDTLKLLPEPSAILNNEQKGNIYNSILIGNTKAIWPIFLKWLASRVEEKIRESDGIISSDVEALEHINSPFDTFVETSITQAIQQCCEDNDMIFHSCQLFWSNGKRQEIRLDEHNYDSSISQDSNLGEKNNYHCFDNSQKDSFLVSMQRVATTTGLYWHDDEATKLCVHPTYGTWTAFRTVVVFEPRNPNCNSSLPTPRAPACLCPVADGEIKAAKSIFDYALQMSSSDELSYGTTLNKSWDEVAEYLHDTICSGSDWDAVPDTMKPWIQLRDVISVGKEHWRYTEPQLLYHYTRDGNILCKEMKRIRDR